MTSGEIRTIDDVRPDDEAGAEFLQREYLTAMYVLVKNGLVFEENNPALLNVCRRAAKVTNIIREHADSSAAIQFLPDGVYINGQLARLEQSAFERGEYLLAIWRAYGVGEISAHSPTSPADWLEVITALKRCIRTGSGADALRDRKFANITLAAIEDIRHTAGQRQSDRKRALRAYAIATLTMHEMLDGIHQGRRVRVVDLKRPLQELVAVAPNSVDLLMSLVHLDRNKQTLANHLINTATIVSCMARPLGLSPRAAARLVLQAALHGVGRATHSPAQLSGDPDARESALALASVCALLRTSSAPGLYKGRIVAANEVRLWANDAGDPATYPYPPSAVTRLITVARSYDQLTTTTAARPGLLPDEALRVLMAEAGRRFDHAAVRILLNLLGVFPVGSVVRFASGELGIPIQPSGIETEWARPTIKLMWDQHGPLNDRPILDLAKEQPDARQILGCVDADSLQINIPAFLLD